MRERRTGSGGDLSQIPQVLEYLPVYVPFQYIPLAQV